MRVQILNQRCSQSHRGPLATWPIPLFPHPWADDAAITSAALASHGQTEVVTSGPTPTHDHFSCTHHGRDIWSAVFYRVPRNAAHALTL